MQIAISLHRLAEYAQACLPEPGTLWGIQISEIKGGFASDGVYRIDLTFLLDKDSFETVSVVQKHASGIEVRVMELLDKISSGRALPQVIDSSERDPIPGSGVNSWVIMPFFKDRCLTFEDAIPADVVKDLAYVHAHFSSHVADLGEVEGLRQFDSAFTRARFKNALATLLQMQKEQPRSNYDALCSTLQSLNQSTVFNRALSKLPVTLTHGDVHPGNMIQSTEGESVLIDWGNARIAPQMLDIANVVKIDSDNWAVYLDAWEELIGEPMVIALAELGYRWATAMVSLQYLPFAAGNLPDAVPGMVESIRQAEEQLAYLLKSK